MIDINKIRNFILGKGQNVTEDIPGGYKSYYKQTEPNIFGKIADYGQNVASNVLQRFGQSLPSTQPSPYNSQPSPSPTAQYSPMPTDTPQPTTQPTPQPTQQPQYTYPDKAPIPTPYRSVLDTIPNSDVVGSVLAQETGGYDYNIPDTATGKIVSLDVARQKKIVGPAGEVGIAQIIPKWYWKDAGFPSEESYANALYDPQFAIQEAGRILNHNYEVYGNWKDAIGGWNKRPSYYDEVMGRIKNVIQGENK